MKEESGHLHLAIQCSVSLNSAEERYGAASMPRLYIYTSIPSSTLTFSSSSALVYVQFLVAAAVAPIFSRRRSSAESSRLDKERKREKGYRIKRETRGYPVRNWTKERDYIVVVVTIEHLSYCPKWVLLRETEKSRDEKVDSSLSLYRIVFSETEE